MAQSLSVAGTCRALGILPRGGNYATVHRAVERLGLDTQHWTGQAWNRGRRGYSSPTRRPLTDLLRAGVDVGSHKLRLRLVAAGLRKEECALCGGKVWLGLPMPLELDHINGIRTDNRLENLRLVCPNCHALTETYRGRNVRARRRIRAAAALG